MKAVEAVLNLNLNFLSDRRWGLGSVLQHQQGLVLRPLPSPAAPQVAFQGSSQ